ncbi:hypothetical protein WJX75_008188 [Coccomyxa subellipsoidea]|uniref:Uncharacterized protein n=1 Tax=Coccomyxa subellipsoidea TaxID=248742 RepID=A0ABR2YJS7_9CHLO
MSLNPKGTLDDMRLDLLDIRSNRDRGPEPLPGAIDCLADRTTRAYNKRATEKPLASSLKAAAAEDRPVPAQQCLQAKTAAEPPQEADFKSPWVYFLPVSTPLL